MNLKSQIHFLTLLSVDLRWWSVDKRERSDRRRRIDPGTVTDPGGAIVPGASVTVTNVATGVETTKQD